MTAPRQIRRHGRHLPASGLWRGTVERVVGGRVWITIPRLAPGRFFGPLSALPDLPTPLAAGQRILVGFIEDNPDDPEIIRRL